MTLVANIPILFYISEPFDFNIIHNLSIKLPLLYLLLHLHSSFSHFVSLIIRFGYLNREQNGAS